MPSVWFALKRSLTCKAQPSDVHDPKKIVPRASKHGAKSDCSVSSSCPRSIPNVNKVVNTSMSRKSMRKPEENIQGNEPIEPIVHEVVRNNQTVELTIRYGSGRVMGTLVPGTPGPGEHVLRSLSGGSRNLNRSFGKSDSFRKRILNLNSGITGIHRKRRGSRRSESHNDVSAFSCRKCGEKFVRLQDVEAHHLCQHAVTELVEGDSTRNIVQLICISSVLKSNITCDIERILKVHNLQKSISKFEEYRDMVKQKASDLSKKYPRCLADGNELLRFYGTTTECLLGMNGSSGLCSSNRCSVCRILRNGFSLNKKKVDGSALVFTASSSDRALASIDMVDSNNTDSRKALIVCRVIAGRVHMPLENTTKETDSQLDYDSLAGKEDINSNIQELYVWNPRAILPCFVIMCKP